MREFILKIESLTTRGFILPHKKIHLGKYAIPEIILGIFFAFFLWSPESEAQLPRLYEVVEVSSWYCSELRKPASGAVCMSFLGHPSAADPARACFAWFAPGQEYPRSIRCP